MENAAVFSRKSTALLQTVLFTTIFVLIVSFRSREFGDDSVDWQVGMRLGFLAIAAGASFYCFKAWTKKLLQPENFLFIPFFILMFGSSLYAPSLAYSAGCTFSLFAIFALFYTCNTVLGEQRTISTVITVCSFVSIASLFVYFAMPDIGTAKVWEGDNLVSTRRLSGITGPNGAGFIAASMLLLITILKRRHNVALTKLSYLFIAVNLATLVLSESRTSAAAMLIALGCLFFSNLSPTRIALLFGGIAAAMILALTIDSDHLLVMLSRSGDASEVTSGTGRLYIWKTAIELIQQRPFLGWGYGSASFILPLYAVEIGHAPPHCHNATLQIIFSIGWIGGFVFVGMMIGKLYSIISRKSFDRLVLFVFVTITGLTEATAFGGLANIATIIYAVLFSMNNQEMRPKIMKQKEET